MANSKQALSPNSLSSRKPYDPISQAWEIPASLYEAKHLALQSGNTQLVALLDSIIQVAQVDPHTWRNLPQTATAGEGR